MRRTRKLTGAGERLGALSIAAIAVIVVYDVIARKFGHPLLWSLEISGYLMIAASVLPAGEVLNEDGHFQLRLLVDLLPRHLESMIALLTDAIGSAFSAAITYGCILLIVQSHNLGIRSSTMLRVPLVYPQAILCAGFAILCVAYCRRFLHRLQLLTRR